MNQRNNNNNIQQHEQKDRRETEIENSKLWK